jgi:hypothetical protein
MGVIVETTGIRRSANGKDYMIWHISDLIVNILTVLTKVYKSTLILE